MTNLQAMQDERLQDLIHQVEQLERLYNQVSGFKFNADYTERLGSLENEIREGKTLIRKRWKELLES